MMTEVLFRSPGLLHAHYPVERAMLTRPDTYENPKGDNPWDNDAVQWLLTHEDVAAEFDRHNLMECARRQKKRLETDLNRVIGAAQLCERHGVHQVQVFD